MQVRALTGKNLKMSLDYGKGWSVARDNGTKSKEAPETPEVSFRELLTAVVDGAPMSRDELARRVGRTGAAISQWINRGDMPDLAVVFKLENELGLPFGQLVRRHSPDIWMIIEAKSGANTWHNLSPKEKFNAALAEAQLRPKQRDLLLEALANYLELNEIHRTR